MLPVESQDKSSNAVVRASGRNTSKIFVISLHRTMTRSTDILLSQLGYRTRHYMNYHAGRNLVEAVRGLENQRAQVVDLLAPAIECYDAVSDVPIPALYRELAERWPDSRFILVIRDAHQWVSSVRGHVQDAALSPFNRIQYQRYLGPSVRRLSTVSDAQLVSMYHEHTDAIQAYFTEERQELDRLCVASMAEGEVGERICRFLGHPPRSLPHFSGHNLEEDLEACRAWVSVCPQQADARCKLASKLIKLGRDDEARPHLEAAIAAEPDQPKPYSLLSDLFANAGNGRAAAVAAGQALNNGLPRTRLHRRAATAAVRRGRLIEAMQHFCRYGVQRVRRWRRES